MDRTAVESAAAPPLAIAGDHELGGWTVVRPLAVSRQFKLALARPAGCDQQSPADYVIKRVREDAPQPTLARRLLAREIEISSAVADPHLAPVLAANLNLPCPYLVRPYLDGHNARELLGGPSKLRLRSVLWWCRQVAQGVAVLHGRGWVHGDIKPDNIIVSPTGHVTLIDLGFASQPDADQLPLAPPLQTSLSYAAPELISESFGLTTSADVYSLGVTMYELLSGRAPFTGTAAEVARAHVEQPPIDPREFAEHIPAHVARLVLRLLSKLPAHRPTAYDLVEKLYFYEITYFAA